MKTAKATRVILTVAAVIVFLVLLWEGYKWMGQKTDDHWPGTNFGLPIATNDTIMPHFVDVITELNADIRDGRSTMPMYAFLLKKAWFTFQEAAIGFILGLTIGMSLAILMSRWKVSERGLLPWINVSQTIPLIALAPVVVTWGRNQGLSDLISISLISTYLTFFPVAVSGLRGLQSPDSAHVELMHSYAASWRTTLFKLRLPAARPFLFPALKLAGSLSIVGAIVGEISIGRKTGLGRAILEYALRYAIFPERLYASVIGAAFLGLLVFGMINLAERYFMRRTREVAS